MHGVEMIYRIMGRGCESVACVETNRLYFATGVWKDGRVGTWRGIRTKTRAAGKGGYGVTVFGTQAIATTGSMSHHMGYKPLTVAIAEFFKSGKPPVDPQETIELYAFLEAAEQSKRQGGAPVRIEFRR